MSDRHLLARKFFKDRRVREDLFYLLLQAQALDHVLDV
ncbi:MAG: hypothetical protein QOG16_1158, partial [Actinomycetota bacterium]|nr:hypothetical protein [Actinomycetota bacterium]